MDNVKEKFNQYVLTFDHSNEGVIRKHAHSFRVAKYALNIAQSLNLSPKQVYLAELIGLLHDIGRFKQATKFNSFDDSKTFDHGDYAAQLLFEENKIKDFHEDENDYKVIRSAIVNHNKFDIEDNLSYEELLMARIIRDADKLDILYQVLIEKIELDIDNEDLNPKTLEAFRNEDTVANQDMVTKEDKTIGMIALIFDLNFDYSLNYAKDNFVYKIMDKYEVDLDLQELVTAYFKRRNIHVSQ